VNKTQSQSFNGGQRGFRGNANKKLKKLIAHPPKERKKTILEYRFFTGGFSLIPYINEKTT
jgi:hypothetical protein